MLIRGRVKRSRWRSAVVAQMAAAVLLAAGCGNGSEPESGAPELDPVSLQAEIDAGTLQAEPIPNSYVAAVNDDLLVAVAVEDSDDGGQVARVYLCDGAGVSVWLSGEIASDQPTQLGGFDDGASIEFVVTDEVVHGQVVTAKHGGPQYFEAAPAFGEAGLYRAEQTLDGDDYLGGWIVLDDGRQQGQICTRICSPQGVCFWHCRQLN
jgi:hypothetical protein